MKSKGVVHRCINTDNIITCDKNHLVAARLIDFKFATIEGMDPLFPYAGTPGFFAPETILTEYLLPDHKQDVFSLGVVFYSLL